MQQLSHTILLSGTVDVWHFVVGYLGEVQANLKDGERRRRRDKYEERGRRRMSAGMQLRRGRSHTVRSRLPR